MGSRGSGAVIESTNTRPTCLFCLLGCKYNSVCFGRAGSLSQGWGRTRLAFLAGGSRCASAATRRVARPRRARGRGSTTYAAASLSPSWARLAFAAGFAVSVCLPAEVPMDERLLAARWLARLRYSWCPSHITTTSCLATWLCARC